MRSLGLVVMVAVTACGDGGGNPDARRSADGPPIDGAANDAAPSDAAPVDAPVTDAAASDAPATDAPAPDAATGLHPSICPGVPNNTEPDVVVATGGVTSGSFAGTQDNGANPDPDVVVIFALPDVDQVQVWADGLYVDGDPALMSVTLRRCGGGIGCTHDTNNPPDAAAQRGRDGHYSVFVEGDDTFAIDSYNLYITGTITPNGRCDLPLAQSGALACAPGTTCNGTHCVAGTACSDGIDADGDGHLGYPYDPGCAGIGDASEADDCATTQLDCPACATTADEDGDGDAGYPRDVGCDFIGDADEVHWCETDPDFPDFCPMCSDGFDNDLDGDTDFVGGSRDCGCDWAAEDSESPES